MITKELLTDDIKLGIQVFRKLSVLFGFMREKKDCELLLWAKKRKMRNY
jgi:hypothetical protein